MMTFCSKLNQQKGFQHDAAATEVEVFKAEEALGLHFAEDYREYLLAYGSASFYGHTFTGISQYDAINVVKVTEEARQYYPGLNLKLYVIEEAHIDGILICQDITQSLYLLLPDSIPKKIANDLIEYLLISE